MPARGTGRAAPDSVAERVEEEDQALSLYAGYGEVDVVGQSPLAMPVYEHIWQGLHSGHDASRSALSWATRSPISSRASLAAVPNPAIPATFWVPLLSPLSCPPP